MKDCVGQTVCLWTIYWLDSFSWKWPLCAIITMYFLLLIEPICCTTRMAILLGPCQYGTVNLIITAKNDRTIDALMIKFILAVVSHSQWALSSGQWPLSKCTLNSACPCTLFGLFSHPAMHTGHIVVFDCTVHIANLFRQPMNSAINKYIATIPVCAHHNKRPFPNYSIYFIWLDALGDLNSNAKLAKCKLWCFHCTFKWIFGLAKLVGHLSYLIIIAKS